MAQAEKAELATWLRAFIKDRYGSLAKAAKAVNVDYENFRKQLERNSFSKNDLEKLLPAHESVENLSRQYKFIYRHDATEHDVEKPVSADGNKEPVGRSFASFIDNYFLNMTYINPQIPLEEFVLAAYNALGNNDIQILFFDPTYLPVEWGIQDSKIVHSIRELLLHGASICYLSPYSKGELAIKRIQDTVVAAELAATVKTPARAFKEFSKTIFSGADEAIQNGGSGLLVHIRVEQSPFASPFQKWSLFSLHERDEDDTASLPAANKVSLLTTKIVRGRNQGKANAIEVVLAQARDIVNAQLEFLKQTLEGFIEGRLDQKMEIEMPAETQIDVARQTELARRILADLDVGFIRIPG